MKNKNQAYKGVYNNFTLCLKENDLFWNMSKIINWLTKNSGFLSVDILTSTTLTPRYLYSYYLGWGAISVYRCSNADILHMNALRKGMNPSILHPTPNSRKKLGSSSLVKGIIQLETIHRIYTCYIPLKIDLVSLHTRGQRLGKCMHNLDILSLRPALQ